MLWVNLIMDTFAALALASLPPDEKVMLNPPRKTTAHIITKRMASRILGVGGVFLALLFGLLQYFKHTDITSLTQFNGIEFFACFFDFGQSKGLSAYEMSLFFTIFVLLQFWNMFNAKAFGSGRSAFSGLRKSAKGFNAIALVIPAGQYFIVTFGGKMFNVTPLNPIDWAIIIIATSSVLCIGEIGRLLKCGKAKKVSCFCRRFIHTTT
jgi:Ca2+-transporting ATPase